LSAAPKISVNAGRKLSQKAPINPNNDLYKKQGKPNLSLRSKLKSSIELFDSLKQVDFSFILQRTEVPGQQEFKKSLDLRDRKIHPRPSILSKIKLPHRQP